MLVGMWMNREPVTIRPSESVAAAAGLLARRRIRRLLVTDVPPPAARLVGIVTLHDVARAFSPDVNPLSAAAPERGPTRSIDEIMTRRVLTVTPDTPLEEAAHMLLEHKVGAVPVVHAGGELAGIVTESDIFRAFCEVVGARTPCVRITLDLSGSDDPVVMAVELAARHGLKVASVLAFDHAGRRLGVVRLIGPHCEALIDELWRLRHPVLSVLRPGGGEAQREARLD